MNDLSNGVKNFIHPLPPGRYEGCEVATVGTTTFVRVADGRVFTTRRGGLHLLSAWGSNDKERAAYARLAGVSMADMRRAYKKRRAELAKADAEDSVQKMRRLAAKHGYSLKKVKKP